MNKRILILLVPMMTLVLSGCGKNAPRYPSDPSDPSDPSVPSTGTSGASGQSGTTGAPSSSGGSESSATSVEPGTDVLESITIGGDMSFKTYAVGNSFNPAGLTASGHYSVSGDKDITGNVEWAFTPATAAAETTSVSVTASASGVTSAAKTITGITVTAEKSKMRIAYEVADGLENSPDQDHKYPSPETYDIEGVITGKAGNYPYVQDGQYGLYIYSNIPGAEVGKTLSLKSSVIKYQGILETSKIEGTPVVGSTGTLPTPINVTGQSILDTSNQNLLANMSNALLKTKQTWSSSANALNVFTVGGDDITVKFDKYSYNGAPQAVKDAYTAAAEGKSYNLTDMITTVYMNMSASTVKHQLVFITNSGLSEVTKTVESIVVKTAPTKTTYNKGESFNGAGLVLTVRYTDNSSEDIAYNGHESDFTFSPSGALSTGTTSVTITYGGKSTTQPITVNDKTIVSIAITGTAMTKKNYYLNDNWDPAGLVVTATYSDASTDPITSGITFAYDPATANSKLLTSVKVTATYTGGSSPIVSPQVTITGITVTASTTTTDVLDLAFTTRPAETSYGDWTATSASGVSYSGNSAGDKSSIQIRSKNSNSGIVSTSSVGTIKKVIVSWHADTADDRTLDIYGSNSAYTSPTQLYGTPVGTKLGSINKSGGTEFTVPGSYAYIGLRSNNGAMYLLSITIIYDLAA